MASPTPKPTIVVVPGSFTTEELYATLIDKIRANGYDAVFTRHFTTIRTDGPIPTMFDDAAQIHSICEKLVDEGKDIVLMMHSYGGIPGTEAARGLSKRERGAAGKKGGIVKLLYQTAIVAKAGESVYMALGNDMPTLDEMGGIADQWMHIEAEYHVAHTYSDLPCEEAIAWSAKMSQHAAQSFHDQLTYEAFKHIPAMYLMCMEDRLISPEQQGKFVDLMRSLGAEIEVLGCDAGHCAMISQPEAVVHAIRVASGERNLLRV